jgi:L-iditol 2-dehydrogenase
MGATTSIDLHTPRNERLEQARTVTGGRGFDVVIEASGNADAVSEALDLVRDGGRVVVCGHYTDNGAVEIHPHWQINRKHVELRGCWGSRYEHFHRAVELAARFGDTRPWHDLAGKSYALADVASALDAVASRAAVKAVVRV